MSHRPHRLRRLAAAVVLAVPVVTLPVAASGAVPTALGAAAGGYSPGSADGIGAGGAYGYGGYGGGGYAYEGGGSYGAYRSSASSTADADPASAQESRGVVLVDTVLDYGEGEAAGTGLVLTGDGIVVTNHHVIADSTSIEVTVPSTGRTYVADVVGYDATDDVAVLQLEDASGLVTVATEKAAPTAGEAVTAVGNAEGGGTLLAADGTVTATGSDISVSDEQGGTESLRDLIQVDADIVSGDSGGALLDAEGDVVGMNVAASSGSADVTGYAIPIGTVLDVAASIMAGGTTGETAGDLTLGYDAALGVQLFSGSGSPQVAGVVEDGAAERAGVTAGSAITSLDGTAITTTDDLTSAIATHAAGEKVRLGWTDSGGQTHTATVTLGRAPVA